MRLRGQREAHAAEELTVVLKVAGFHLVEGNIPGVPGLVVGMVDIGRSLTDGVAVEAVEAGGVNEPER